MILHRYLYYLNCLEVLVELSFMNAIEQSLPSIFGKVGLGLQTHLLYINISLFSLITLRVSIMTRLSI